MSDIGVYVKEEVLHRDFARDLTYLADFIVGVCFWELPTIPDLKVGERFWFAALGRWRGYYIVDNIEDAATSWCVVYLDSRSWHDHDGGPQKAFQRFTYKVPRRPDS
jgi:hypothetical protein